LPGAVPSPRRESSSYSPRGGSRRFLDQNQMSHPTPAAITACDTSWITSTTRPHPGRARDRAAAAACI